MATLNETIKAKGYSKQGFCSIMGWSPYLLAKYDRDPDGMPAADLQKVCRELKVRFRLGNFLPGKVT